jgi:hypothetical protein
MQPAYIISAYKRPDLLARLVRRLGDAPIAIHIDRKSDIFDQVKSYVGGLPNVTLLPRHVCHWGLIGHVDASLEGMKWFRGTDRQYAVLLTGQCYPVKPPAEIERDLNDLHGRSIIETIRFPVPKWMQYENGGYTRLDRFHLKIGRRPRPRWIKLWNRRPPYGLHPHGGNGYWCLSRQAIEYILDYVAAHPGLRRYFRTTFVPDEMVFQTILANSPLKDTIVSADVHYIDWSCGGPNPVVFEHKHLPDVLASGAWFARKFDDHGVLDALDALRDDPARVWPQSEWRRK